MSDKINSHIYWMLSVYKIFIKWSDMATKETVYYKQLGLKFKYLWRPVKPNTGL